MRYQIAPLFCRPWTLLGMAPQLIERHYESNYGGTFTRLNRRGDARPLVQDQLADVPSVTVEGVKAMLDAGTPVQIIDARPRHSSSRSPDMMEAAVWRDPDRVDEWMSDLSQTAPVVAFCLVHDRRRGESGSLRRLTSKFERVRHRILSFSMGGV